jgi:hypothetical protein
MNFADWLLLEQPGKIIIIDDRVEITHDCGDRSTLWLQNGPLLHWMQGELRDFYGMYDGADLFSSTFKIASISETKAVGGVDIIFTQDQIQRELDVCNFSLPERTSAFMYQSGIGIYSASHTSPRIYECDTETGDVTRFESLRSIFEEWLDAIAGK